MSSCCTKRKHEMFRAIVMSVVVFPAISGCGFPGGSDFSAPLSNGYSVHRMNADEIIVAPDDGHDWQTPIIGSKVVELDHDLTWVIAKQRPAYDAPLSGSFSYWILRNSNKTFPIGSSR